MTAVAAKPTAGGAVDMTAMIIGLIILLVVIAATYFVLGSGLAFMALIGINARFQITPLISFPSL